MAIPVLKCPYLSQLTLQQVRASASNIFNAGMESCPIFSQFARKISTSNVHDTGNISSVNTSSTSRPLSMDEIRAVHDRLREQKNHHHSSFKVESMMKTPSPYGESKQNLTNEL